MVSAEQSSGIVSNFSGEEYTMRSLLAAEMVDDYCIVMSTHLWLYALNLR